MRTIAARNVTMGDRIFIDRKVVVVWRAYYGEDGAIHITDVRLVRYVVAPHHRFRLAPERREVDAITAPAAS